MNPNNALGNGQSQAVAPIHGSDLVHTVKPLKNIAQVLMGYLLPGICYRQGAVASVSGKPHLHIALPGGVFQRVVQQNSQKLPQMLAAATDENIRLDG